jgi:signal transduction histidine kinase
VNLEEARAAVTSHNPRERLEAARVLAREALPQDAELIKQGLRSETVSWIRSALRQAFERAMGAESPAAIQSDVETPAVDDVYAEAVEETAGKLIHELSPIVGAARLYAEIETPGFKDSRLKRQLDRLDQMLDAIRTLSRAAAAPRLSEFDLPELVTDVVEGLNLNAGPEVETIGPEDFTVHADPALVALVIRNGFTNAIEATLALDGDALPAIVTRWDDTDKDYWIVVLDRGVGLPPTASQIFEIGVTGKRGHEGMGLSLARRAAQSLGGRIRLTPRQGGGIQYEFRWPKPAKRHDENSHR